MDFEEYLKDENLSTKTENELEPVSSELDLRAQYITPLFIQSMRDRLPDWSEDHLKRQIRLFHRTIPDYPEVLEILEGELHKRNLNTLLRHIRRDSSADLQKLLERYGHEPDFREVIETEIEIRGGALRLYDASGET